MEVSSFEESLVAAFERVAKKYSSRVALGSDAWTPTFGELNETANCLAHRLIAAGVMPGGRVAILMSHDAPLVAAVVGTLKAGQIVVALDPSDPIARLKMLIDDSEPSVVVTDLQNRTLAVEIGINCAVLNWESEVSSESTQSPSINILPEQTAFLTYTSGTTGRPKGVMQTHRQLRRAAAAHIDAMQFTENDRVPLFAMISTGQGSVGLWWILLSGAMLWPFSLKTTGVVGLADWITERALTVYVSSASIYRTLVKTINDRAVFSNIRAVRLASEAVTADDFRAFKQHFPQADIFVHTLSSSETSNIAWSRWTRHDTISEGTLSVGHFSRDMHITLVDDDGQPAGRGEVGEIVVKSRYLANGYWRDPKLTAEKFSTDLDGQGTRLFRTGDLGRINADGQLEFCGRKDDRVKIRGSRIELLDIERAIERLPGIDRAAAIAAARENNEPLLVAFVVGKSDASWTAPRLRHALAATMPRHMVPSRIVFVDSLPYNRGNKIDRETLRQNFISTRGGSNGERPKTDTELLLADIWAETLDLPDVSRDEDFFNLGGDSLSGSVVETQIHAALRVALTLGDIVDHPTISALAAFIHSRRHKELVGLPPIVSVPRKASMPMSLFQERIWNYYCHPENRAAWTLIRTHRITGPLDIEILKSCLSYLAERHEILRSTFGIVDGQPAQVIHPSTPFDFSFVDLIGADDPEVRAETIFREEDSLRIDLQELPIMRHILIRVAHEKYRLARIFSHIISDGSTSHILNAELALLYEAKLQGMEPPLPRNPPLQYADYAAWQRQVMQPSSASFEAAMNWWKNLISPASLTVRLPFRRLTARDGLDPSEGVLRWSLEKDAARRLDQIARNADATYFTVRLAAFAALIADVTANSNVVIGTNFVTRNQIEMQHVVGPFVNTIPLVFSYDATKTFLEWLEIVRDRVFETRTWGELSYDELKQHLRAGGIEPPEIRIIFAMAGDHSDRHFGKLTMSTEFWGVGKMPWGCTFFVEEQKPEYCRVNFDAGLYDRNGMRAMVDRYLRLLEAAARQPELPVGKLLAMTGAKPLRWVFANYVWVFYEFLKAITIRRHRRK